MPQKSLLKPYWRAPVAAALLLLSCSVVSAQWVWKEGERKVFSDTAPPASVAEKNIIKRPGGGGAMPRSAAAPGAPSDNEASPNAAAAPAPVEPKAAVPQLPTVDKELEAKKKQAEQAEEARKKAEDQRVAQGRAESCSRAKQAKVTLESGIRMATTNAKGEREIMDDKARTAENRRLDEIVRSNCGPLPKPVAQ
jgi:type IV secretory pathway VirB10-like protein